MSELRSPTRIVGRSLVSGPAGATSSAACWARMLGTTVCGSNDSRWVSTKWNGAEPRTVASTEAQPRVTVTLAPESSTE